MIIPVTNSSHENPNSVTWDGSRDNGDCLWWTEPHFHNLHQPLVHRRYYYPNGKRGGRQKFSPKMGGTAATFVSYFRCLGDKIVDGSHLREWRCSFAHSFPGIAACMAGRSWWREWLHLLRRKGRAKGLHVWGLGDGEHRLEPELDIKLQNLSLWPMSPQSFHNLPKQCPQRGDKCKNTRDVSHSNLKTQPTFQSWVPSKLCVPLKKFYYSLSPNP